MDNRKDWASKAPTTAVTAWNKENQRFISIESFFNQCCWHVNMSVKLFKGLLQKSQFIINNSFFLFFLKDFFCWMDAKIERLTLLV